VGDIQQHLDYGTHNMLLSLVVNEVFKLQKIPGGRYLNWLDTHDEKKIEIRITCFTRFQSQKPSAIITAVSTKHS